VQKGLVRSEILCPDVWGDPSYFLDLPVMYEGDRIHLSFTIPTFGKIEGFFEVTGHLHLYDSRTGYTQRLVLAAEDS
jgi:hypothetical protein